MLFCVREEVDPVTPSVNKLLTFLYELFRSGGATSQGLGYSAMNTVRSAISAIANIDGVPAGQHGLVKRFLKAVFRERPALARYQNIWDPDVVLDHIKTLGLNKDLSIIQLSRKLVILMLLLSGQRAQTLHLLDVRHMELSFSRATFHIGDLLKTTRPGSHFSEIVFKAYAPNRRLCVITALKEYLYRTLDVRGSTKRLFLTTRSPVRAASRDTLRRWTRDILAASGIDVRKFAPASTRSASVSKASLKIPTSLVVKTIGWSSESMWAKYYNKPLLPRQSFADAILLG